MEAAAQRIAPVAINLFHVEQSAARWGLAETASPALERLAAYGNLLLRWNARIALTAIRDEAELVERHLMEGVFAAAHQPTGRNVLDFGSGTGIPGIPIAICRSDLHVTLAEANRRKASFLQEAVRAIQLPATVYAGRAETLAPGSFDAVWMRAVDKAASMLPLAASLVSPTGALCLLGTGPAPSFASDRQWQWDTYPLPGSDIRVLHIGRPA
jgi:16S rRNA (guanine527-N7)-methyltransferase